MLEPLPTGTVYESVEAAESSTNAHGSVQGYTTQRLRSKLSKGIGGTREKCCLH